MPVITSNEEIVAMHGWLGGQWRKYNDPLFITVIISLLSFLAQ